MLTIIATDMVSIKQEEEEVLYSPNNR